MVLSNETIEIDNQPAQKLHYALFWVIARKAKIPIGNKTLVIKTQKFSLLFQNVSTLEDANHNDNYFSGGATDERKISEILFKNGKKCAYNKNTILFAKLLQCQLQFTLKPSRQKIALV